MVKLPDGREIGIPGFGAVAAPQPPPSGGGFWDKSKEQLGLNQPAYQGSPQVPQQGPVDPNQAFYAQQANQEAETQADFSAGAAARDQKAWDRSSAMAGQSGPISHLKPAQPITGTNPLDKYKYAAGQLPGMGSRSSDDPLNDNDWDFINTLPGGVDDVASYKKNPASFQAPPPGPQGSLLANMTSSRRANMEKRPYR